MTVHISASEAWAECKDDLHRIHRSQRVKLRIGEFFSLIPKLAASGHFPDCVYLSVLFYLQMECKKWFAKDTQIMEREVKDQRQGQNFDASQSVHFCKDSCQINLRESTWTLINCQKFHNLTEWRRLQRLTQTLPRRIQISQLSTKF